MRPREDAVSAAIRLSLVTIAWDVVSGIVAVASGIVYDSLSLAAFGLSMLIDTAASVALVWRFHLERSDPHGADRLEARAEVAIGVAMVCAALYLLVQTVHSLVTH